MYGNQIVVIYQISDWLSFSSNNHLRRKETKMSGKML